MANARLERPRGARMLAGVCSGLAGHYGWSVTKVRWGFVLFGLFGAGEIVYIALWIIMPNAQR